MPTDEYLDFEPGETKSPGKTGFDAEPKKEFNKATPWQCLYCGYMPNLDTIRTSCENCGRNRIGESGTVPDELDKDVRKGLRSDA